MDEKIQELQRQKQSAVKNEDYDKAEDLKNEIDSLRMSVRSLPQLEAQKAEAVKNEHYKLAKKLKGEMEAIMGGMKACAVEATPGAPSHVDSKHEAGTFLAYQKSDEEFHVVATDSWHEVRRFPLDAISVSLKIRGHEVHEVSTDYTDVKQCCFSADRRFLAFSVATSLRTMGFSPLDHIAVALHVWTTEDWAKAAKVTSFSIVGGKLAFCFSADSQFLAYGGEDMQITIVATDGWAKVRSFSFKEEYTMQPWHRGYLDCCSFSADGHFLAYAGGFGHDGIKVWVVATQNWENVKTFSEPKQCEALSFSVDGRFLAIGSRLELTVVARSDWTTVKEVRALGLTDCCFSPDSRYLAYTGSQYSQIAILATEGWAEVHKGSSKGRIFGIHCGFSLDGRFLAYSWSEERKEKVITVVTTDGWAEVKSLPTKSWGFCFGQSSVGSSSSSSR